MSASICTSWLEMLGSRVLAESTKITPWHALLELAARCNAKMLLLFRVEAPRYASKSNLRKMQDRVETF